MCFSSCAVAGAARSNRRRKTEAQVNQLAGAGIIPWHLGNVRQCRTEVGVVGGIPIGCVLSQEGVGKISASYRHVVRSRTKSVDGDAVGGVTFVVIATRRSRISRSHKY